MEGLTPKLLASEVVFEWKEGKVKGSIENILIPTFIDELATLENSSTLCGNRISNRPERIG